MANTILTDIQTDLIARLNADAYFSDVSVLSARTVNVVDDIQEALGTEAVKGGKSGACVIVENVTGECSAPNVPNGLIDIMVIVSVLEDTQNNAKTAGVGKSADAIAWRVKELLHHYEAEGFAHPLFLEKTCIESVLNPFADSSYEVRFRSKAIPASMESKVPTPTITPVVGPLPQTITLGCSLSGAAIYYTLDGSHPAATNANAILYSAPFTISTAKTLRVCAFKSGYIASNCKRVDYTA